MKNYEKVNLIMINAACILALLAVIAPLLMIAQYGRPSADDWSFGAAGYEALKNGEGLLGVLRCSLETVKANYIHWEGRFSSTFLASLQPGIWGERHYGIVAWLMIGSLILSETIFCSGVLCSRFFNVDKRLIAPLIVPSLMLQILYCPYPEESFYWYTGSVNYTFVYGLSLILLTLFLKMGTADSVPKWKYGLWAVSACILAVLVGGNNYATSLSCFLSLFILSVLFLWLDKRAFRRTWFLTAILGLSLIMCVFAPGNANRINANFGGETGNAVRAIIMSLVRSFTNIYSWTNLKVILMILFIFPFAWKAVKTSQYSFRFPGLFTMVTFGLYASQITATMYVDGTTGGGRMGDILFYSYYVWVLGNACYWIGWLSRKRYKILHILKPVGKKIHKYILLYCAIIGIVLSAVFFQDLRTLTSYKAYRNWRQGFAQQYASQWDERLEVLHDDSISEVEFMPLSVRPEMLMYTDLQDENGYVWVNGACAEYYGKTSVSLSSP